MYYCPGCNASPDDCHEFSVGCPCDNFGTGKGSLTKHGVEDYLFDAVKKVEPMDEVTYKLNERIDKLEYVVTQLLAFHSCEMDGDGHIVRTARNSMDPKKRVIGY